MKNLARKKFRPLLSAFVDGELAANKRVLVERHLASSKESTDEVADMRTLSTWLCTAMEEAANQENWSTFADEVLSGLPPEKLPFFQRLKIRLSELFTYQRNWVLAVGTAVGCVALSLFMWTRPAEPVGYASPHLSIQTVTAKAGSSLKTIVTQTESGDAVVWVVEETKAQEEAPPGVAEEKAPAFESRPHGAGAL
ncbi:MAG: zf-HC2 domain-containing protein [Cystobacterineae bacterium]|nr:zf-HC2 domain-containing protein [Cystobacterineae bacterium]